MTVLGPSSSIDRGSEIARRVLAALRTRAWLVYLAVGLGIGVGAALVGDESVGQPAVTMMGFAATTAIVVGVRIHHPARPGPWHLIAACVLLTTVGIGIIPKLGALTSVGEAMTGIGYVAGFAGFAALIRGRVPGG